MKGTGFKPVRKLLRYMALDHDGPVFRPFPAFSAVRPNAALRDFEPTSAEA
jgi:hypothetical protein